MTAAHQPEARFALAIHGGAGTIAQDDLDAPTRERYEHALRSALSAGHEILAQRGHAVDAVYASVRALEDEPLFNAGRGAAFTTNGRVELDAAIMDGRSLACGAVIGLTRSRNPIEVARRVMSDSPHVMLAGEGAEAFAREQAIEAVDPSYFHTEHRWRQLEQARREARIALDHDLSGAPQPGLGTVGAVARDVHGDLAAATSTGGMTNQMWGRVGDTPLIGAGTYANNASCAVSATGHGEFFIRATVARDIAAMMEFGGLTLERAAERKIMLELRSLGGNGGVIAVDRDARVCLTFNSRGMYRAWVTSAQAARVAIFA